MSKEQGSESAVSRSQFIKEEEVAEEKEAQRKVSRREFVKGAAVGGAGVAAAGMLASCAPAATPVPAQECPPCATTWLPESWDEEADVVVCGSGTTGAPAALDAYDAGADVLIIEKKDWLGGQMRRCGGGIAGANTIVQKALGVTDDADSYYDYLIACGEGLVDPELTRVYADNAGPNVDWIIEDLGGQPVSEWDFATPEDKGMTLSVRPGLNISGTPVFYEKYGMELVQRSHWFKANPADLDPENKRFYCPDGVVGFPERDIGRGGTGLWKPLEESITARNIRTMMETTLIGLVATPDGEVLGIKVLSAGKTLYIKAKKGVVLGTGGFVSNPSMVLTYTLTPYTPNAYGGGGGMAMAGEDDGAGTLAALSLGADSLFIGLGLNGGIKIDTKAQVIDVYGNPIPRLYAGGRTAGGVISNQYPTCGHYVGTAVCFGRIAGQNAAALEAWS